MMTKDIIDLLKIAKEERTKRKTIFTSKVINIAYNNINSAYNTYEKHDLKTIKYGN